MCRRFNIIALFLHLFGITLAEISVPEFSTEPIWEENFDALDQRKWTHLVTGWRGGNDEFQYYRNNRKNSFVHDGILHIKPTLTANEYGNAFLYNGTIDLREEHCNNNQDNGCIIRSTAVEIVNPLQSARLLSIDSFSFKYGRVEIKAKMPQGDWLWPAVWLLPTESHYGTWPASGEIDMVEVKGNKGLFSNGESMGVDYMGSTLHFGPYWPYDAWYKAHWNKRLNNNKTFASDFHIYGLEWTDSYLKFTLDGDEIGTITPPGGGFWQVGEFEKDPGGRNPWSGGNVMAPFDREFHLVINLAIGGNFFPDNWQNEGYSKPWIKGSPSQMKLFWEAKDNWLPTWAPETEQAELQVDYIKVFSYTGNGYGSVKLSTSVAVQTENSETHRHTVSSCAHLLSGLIWKSVAMLMCLLRGFLFAI